MKTTRGGFFLAYVPFIIPRPRPNLVRVPLWKWTQCLLHVVTAQTSFTQHLPPKNPAFQSTLPLQPSRTYPLQIQYLITSLLLLRCIAQSNPSKISLPCYYYIRPSVVMSLITSALLQRFLLLYLLRLLKPIISSLPFVLAGNVQSLHLHGIVTFPVPISVPPTCSDCSPQIYPTPAVTCPSVIPALQLSTLHLAINNPDSSASQNRITLPKYRNVRTKSPVNSASTLPVPAFRLPTQHSRSCATTIQ